MASPFIAPERLWARPWSPSTVEKEKFWSFSACSDIASGTNAKSSNDNISRFDEENVHDPYERDSFFSRRCFSADHCCRRCPTAGARARPMGSDHQDSDGRRHADDDRTDLHLQRAGRTSGATEEQ